MGQMSKERINISVTNRQKNQLEKRSKEENLPMAEIIRRALDAYLAWDDPTYAPVRHPPNKERPFIPALKERGFLGRDCKVQRLMYTMG